MNDFEIKGIAYSLKHLNVVDSFVKECGNKNNCFDCYLEFKHGDNNFVDYIQLDLFDFEGNRISIEDHIAKITRSINNLKLSLDKCFYVENDKINSLSSDCFIAILSQIDFRHHFLKKSFNLKIQESSLRQKIFYLKSHGFNNLFILGKLLFDYDVD